MKLLTNWVFYTEDRNGVRTIQSIQECKSPAKTSNYKHLMYLLDNAKDAHVVGHMTANAWNQQYQYIKVAY